LFFAHPRIVAFVGALVAAGVARLRGHALVAQSRALRESASFRLFEVWWLDAFCHLTSRALTLFRARNRSFCPPRRSDESVFHGSGGMA